MPAKIITDTMHFFNAAGNISNAIENATGLEDLKSKMDVNQKSALPSALKEMLSVAAITVNTALSPIMDAGLKTFEGTEVEKLEKQLTEKFMRLIENDETGATQKIFESFAQANQIKNTVMVSPATSAAISFVLPLALGSIAGPIGLGAAAGVIAAQVAIGAKENNAVDVKTDELLHLQDYSNSKMIKNQSIELLSLNNKLNPKDLEELFGVKYEVHSNNNSKIAPIENKTSISSKEVASDFMKGFALNIAEVSASNLISTGAAIVQGPHAVAASLARIAISSLANVSQNITQKQAKLLIDEKISQLREQGPEYKKVVDKLPSYRRITNKGLNKIRKALNFSEVSPLEIKVSRKYDLANKAMDEKVNALALERLSQLSVSAKTEKEYKQAEQLENSFKIISMANNIEDKVEQNKAKNSKEYQDAKAYVRKRFMEEKADALKEIKKDPLYQYEQIHKPKTILSEIKKRVNTSLSTAASYLYGGTKTYSSELDSIQEKINKYNKEKEARENEHQEKVKGAKNKTIAEKVKGAGHKILKNVGLNTKDHLNASNEIPVVQPINEAIDIKNIENEHQEKVNGTKNRTIAEKVKGAGHKILKNVGLNTKDHLNSSNEIPVAQPINEAIGTNNIARATPLPEKDIISESDRANALKLISMIENKEDKQKIIDHINNNCTKEALSMPTKSGVSLIEYAVEHKIGSKVASALVHKGEFSHDQINSAISALKEQNKKISLVNRKEKTRNTNTHNSLRDVLAKKSQLSSSFEGLPVARANIVQKPTAHVR